jgi:hypothetical protein
MPEYLANQDMQNALVDLRDNGLHLLMDKLIRDRDYAGAEMIAHQMDRRIAFLIDTTRRASAIRVVR